MPSGDAILVGLAETANTWRSLATGWHLILGRHRPHAQPSAHPAAAQIESLRRALPSAALVVFGWTYPHFVSTHSWIEYAYAAPLGLIPCPTLSVVIGFTLLVRDVGTSA